jgi:hypothetical protein
MTKASFPESVFVEIYDHYGPIDRGDIYEDPLSEFLESEGIGELTGAGTQLAPSGEIIFIGLDLQLADTNSSLSTVKQFLEDKGAPIGSKFIIGEETNRREIPFGVFQEFSIYIEGKDQDSLYERIGQECNFEEFNDLISAALGNGQFGEPRGANGFENKLALYFFAKDVEQLEAALVPLLKQYPIFDGATVIKRVTPGKVEQLKLTF